jgi:hypothetical protein
LLGRDLLLSTCKSISHVLSIAEEIEHTHILLSTAIDNEEMILAKEIKKNSIKRIRKLESSFSQIG